MNKLIFSSTAAAVRIFMDASHIDALKHRLIEINTKALEIQALADGEGRELTAEEAEQVSMLMGEFEAVEADIDRRETLEAQQARLAQPNARRAPNPEPVLEEDDVSAQAGLSAAVARHNAPAQPGDPTAGSSRRRSPATIVDRHPGRWGFGNMGEFALCVARAGAPNGVMDNRLVIHNAPTTTSTEGTGADGGFAVPPDFRTEIAEKVMGDEFSLFGRTDQIPTSRNQLVLPKDENSPWDSAGLQAYWGDELAQMTQSKVNLAQNNIALNKLYVLAPVSEELLSDAPAMDAFLRRKAPERMTWKIEEAIIRGTGVGRPLGILNASGAVTVAAESGPQTADTVVTENLVKMYSRMPARNIRNAVWIINQDVLPQLLTLTISGSNSGVFPVYLPPGGLSSAPFGTILGRPIVFSEACSILGDAGDIIFADLTQYLTSFKTGGVRVDISMHLYFDYDAMAFRFIFRVAGQPWWTKAWTRRDASAQTLSSYVILGARTGS